LLFFRAAASFAFAWPRALLIWLPSFLQHASFSAENEREAQEEERWKR
jgi:hypothetical protein